MNKEEEINIKYINEIYLLNGRINYLENEISELKEHNEELKEDNEELKKDIEELKEDIEKINKKFIKLSDKIHNKCFVDTDDYESSEEECKCCNAPINKPIKEIDDYINNI